MINLLLLIIYLRQIIIYERLYTKNLDETTESINICSIRDIVNRHVLNSNPADVAELADAQASGACGLRPVEVRLLSSALICFIADNQWY